MIKYDLTCPYKVDYFNYYKSETPFDLNNMPEPTKIEYSQLTNMEYIDNTGYKGILYIIFGSVINDIEKLSLITQINTNDPNIGMWIINAICWGNNTLSNLNPLNISHVQWTNNFSTTKDIGAFNYYYKETASADFTSESLTRIINMNPLGYEFKLLGSINIWYMTHARTKIYFETEDNIVLAYIELYESDGSDGNALAQKIKYGLNDVTTTIVPNIGNYGQIDGTLKVTTAGIEYIRNPDATNYPSSFTINTNLSNLKKIRVSDTYGKMTYDTGDGGTGGAAFFYMYCLGKIS